MFYITALVARALEERNAAVELKSKLDDVNNKIKDILKSDIKLNHRVVELGYNKKDLEEFAEAEEQLLEQRNSFLHLLDSVNLSIDKTDNHGE